MKNKYVIIATVMLVIFITARELYERNKLKSNGIYTIGNITDIKSGNKMSFIISYKFSYKNISYKSIDQISKNRKDLVGKRFIIEFVPDNPKISEILYDKRIWCDTLKAPYDGWKEIPDYFLFDTPNGIEVKNIPCEMYTKSYWEQLEKE